MLTGIISWDEEAGHAIFISDQQYILCSSDGTAITNKFEVDFFFDYGPISFPHILVGERILTIKRKNFVIYEKIGVGVINTRGVTKGKKCTG